MLLPLSELFISWMLPGVFFPSTYFNQVYDDNHWWISRYQIFRKGGYYLMIYVGIDIAKLDHFASATSDGKILMEPFKFSNDADGFLLLSSKLETLSLQDDSIIIGLESTAHYGDNLVRYLVASHFNVCVLNPIKTASM